MRVLGAIGFLLPICVCLAGCGKTYQVPGTAKVTGRVTNGGAPLKVEGREIGLGMVTIGFCPLANDNAARAESASAMLDAEGNFEVIEGVKPGNYLITVRQWDPYPQVDRLGRKFDERNSKIIREITEDVELIIDVSKPEG